MKEVTENIFPIEWNLKDELKVPYHGKKVFGTFVCGGGSTMGYKLAGYEHLGGVEFTEHYSKVYKQNHKPKYFYLEDIREFNKRNDLPKELYNLDLLDGSPPCAAFSTAGAREKNWGKVGDYEGIKQTKDDLVYVYSETIEKLKPKVFLLENVSGLAKGNAKVYLKRVVERLSKDYEIQVFLLYAASMGIPQIRNRIFVIGHKKEFKLPKLELNFRVPQLNFEVTQKYWGNTDVPLFKENSAILKDWQETEKGKGNKRHFSMIKNHPKKPSFTITETACDKNSYGVTHSDIPRNLNTEEIRLCSTFPQDYDFMDLGISVMGRSVLPVMMANISNQIKIQWLDKISNN